MGLIHDITAQYSSVEAWAYDTFIAPGVAKMFAGHFDEHFGPQSVRDGFKILDVGCGGGHISLMLAEKFPQASVTGVDLSEGQIARAEKRRTQKSLTNVTFQVADAQDLPFGEGSFDLVLSVACLKHWPDKAKGLAECVRVAKGGAEVNVAEADRGSGDDEVVRFVESWRLPSFLKRKGGEFFRKYVAGQSLTHGEAQGLVEKLPFERVSVDSVEGHPAFHIRGVKEAS